MNYLHIFALIMKDKNKLVANNIKAIRVAKQISQAEVAKALSLTPTAYNRIENNKTQITLNFLFIIAEVLNVEVGELLFLPIKSIAHNHNSIVMANFNNGTLHITVDTEDLKKLNKKQPF